MRLCRFPLRVDATGLACLAVVALAGRPARAQELVLSTAQRTVARLAPDSPSARIDAPLDGCGAALVHVLSSAPLRVAIETPQGRIDEGTIAAAGGSLARLDGSATPDLLVVPQASTGHHEIYRFPCAGAGTYTVALDLPAGVTDEVAAITEVSTDSPLGAALVAAPDAVPAGLPVVLSAVLLEDGAPVAEAGVALQWQRADGPLIDAVMRDDGIEADAAAGDGVYTALIVPTQPGAHFARAVIDGRSTAGAAFRRVATTAFTCTARRARLTPAFSDAGVDDNGNGLFERLRVTVGVDAGAAGLYQAAVRLRSGMGAQVLAVGGAQLAAGGGTIGVDFAALALRRLAEEPPYEVFSVELSVLEPSGAAPVDARGGLGSTAAYRLAQFEGNGVVLAGAVRDAAIDDDGDGVFDRLHVDVPLIVPGAALYEWELTLADATGRPLVLDGSSGLLSSGAATLRIDFDGARIARARVDGPYRLLDLIVDGPGAARSLLADLGTTAAYAARDFGSACAGDCGVDGQVTIDDLVRGVATALGTQPLSNCPSLDGDGDGRVAINELVSAVRSALEGCA